MPDSRPINIALDCRYLGPRPSGIGEMVAALVAHLPGMAPDCRFTLLRAADAAGPLSGAANVREVVVRAAANGPVTLARLPLAVDLTGIDLFHAPANILPGGLRMPSITTVHDIMWLTHPKWCNPSLWGRVERVFYGHGITRALGRSARIATVSAATRDAIAAHAPHVAGRLAVIPSGVAADFTPVPRDPAALARIGVPKGRRFVLMVGQGAPYKNHAMALRAFAAALGSRAGIDLVLVRRRGASGAGLERLAHRLGVAGRVHILPAVARADLVQLYAGAEVLLHPSLCEGFGHPVAEAMACGCPVITSDVSAMPEVAGGAAVLVDPGDIGDIAAALMRVTGDMTLRAALRQRGLARAAMLDWQACAAGYLALYRSVLAEQSPAVRLPVPA
ncbi:glycosyltransferase family 4 protein [Erythrobacter sp. BLCC-B19]|uniref:glycosyltransferase family 4 protein n=1 Tax=Erythrobacter sp. BLCC-B19 TaxID=3025315 RepID=UPI002360DC8A|nr:glycosyltransferase family 1 protein [Erythrobacter sp. BLCC-B19]WDA41818.1 glycosyltransferase family 1 protein [Erythrobacter sp. BLCC-B19]